MSFISEYISPLLDAYSRAIDGSYLSQQLAFKGSQQSGGDYISKVNRSHRKAIQEKYDDAFKSVKQPTFSSFVGDNLPRLLLNPFDRLIAAFQAYPSLKARFTKPGTFSHTFTEILNEGVFLGAFKGVVFNFAQLSLILYPSVYFANKNGGDNKFWTLLSTYTVLDTLFYPLDTLKNILYADTLGKYNIKTVTSVPSLTSLYSGILFKLIYNVPVLSGIYCTTQEGFENQAWASWALAAALYPLNTIKVRSQVATSSLSTININTSFIAREAYRGVVPFLLLNMLVGYSLKPLFSQAKLDKIQGEVNYQLKEAGLRR